MKTEILRVKKECQLIQTETSNDREKELIKSNELELLKLSS